MEKVHPSSRYRGALYLPRLLMSRRDRPCGDEKEEAKEHESLHHRQHHLNERRSTVRTYRRETNRSTPLVLSRK